MTKFKFVESQGLKYEDEVVASFCPKVCSIVKNIDVDKHETFNYTIEVLDQHGMSLGKGTFNHLEKIDWVQEFGVFDPYLKQKMLDNKLRLEARNFQDVHIRYVLPPGVHLVEGQHIMIIGKHVIRPEGFPPNIMIESTSEYELRSVKEDMNTNLQKRIKEYILFEPQISVLLFFGSMYGSIKPILMDMGVNCDMLIALVAPSGHLKTTLVRQYSLWLKNGNLQEISFMDTVRSDCLISKISDLVGLNFLIDDYHKSSSTYTNKKYDERLNVATRAISSVTASAGVIVTAEALKDSRNILFSSHDRIFKIQLPLQSKEKLSEVKKKISMLPQNDFLGNVVLDFGKALINDYDSVSDFVNEFMKKELPSWIDENTRTGNQYRVISLVKNLFMKYLNIQDEEIDRKFTSCLEKTCEKQIAELCKRRNMEHEADVFQLLMLLVEQGSQCKEVYVKYVASSYEAERTDNVLILNKKLYIKRSTLQLYITKKLNYSVSIKKYIDKLNDAGVLEKDSDKRSKKYHGYRHYVIDINHLKTICELEEKNEG